MKLAAPDVIKTLTSKPVIISTGLISLSRVASPSDRGRRDALAGIVPAIHQAEKMIFDSGQDRDEDTVNAVRETAVAMVEHGLFHLPHPLLWVEDPYSSDPTGHTRNYYLCREMRTAIEITLLTQFDPAYLGVDTGRPTPTLSFHTHRLVIPLDEATDQISIPTSPPRPDKEFITAWGEAAYSVKKLIVTLAARGTEIDRVPVQREHGTTGGAKRSYSFSIVRVPLEAPNESHHGGSDTSGRKRWGLVRGYMWGKNTRPLEEQKWVQPYWRGDKSLGIVPRSHYEVG